MSGSSEQTIEGDKPRKRRRWFQFGLSTLLVLTALAAGVAMAWRIYVEPYRRQRETMVLIEGLHGSYQTSAADAWLRRLFGDDFQNITSIDLGACDKPAAYLNEVATLPALETLTVGGPTFTDEHLRRLHDLATLRKLVLDCTGVSDAGLAELREKLPHVEVYDYRELFDALLRDVLTTSSLQDSRDFYGTPGDKKFALVWDMAGATPWRASYRPTVEGFQGYVSTDRNIADAGDAPRLLGIQLNAFKFDPVFRPTGSWIVEGQILVSLFNAGGSGGEPAPIGGCIVFYDVARIGNAWTVTYRSSLDP